MTAQQMIAVQIPISQIRPDPAQPRRLLPHDLADLLFAGTAPSVILAQWRERAKHNKWIRERVAELEGLANSIAVDGLMQPIRVFQDGENTYRIEAGERRWWAHHILVDGGDSRFVDIDAFVIEPKNENRGILRRRVAENVHRSGFTAIELAQAMATRAEEIASEDSTLSRREIEMQVGKENGMSDRRVRQFLGLLKLTEQVQEIAQQARLPEGALRALVSIKDPARQLDAARAMLHPKPKSIESQSRSKNRIVRNTRRHNQRVLRKRSPAPKATSVQSLIALAKKLQQQDSKRFGKQLKQMIAKDTIERDAILHLQSVLKLSLAENTDNSALKRHTSNSNKQVGVKTQDNE